MGVKIKRSKGSVIFDVCNYIFFILMSFIFVYPLVYVLSLSVSDMMALSRGEVKFLPIGFQLDGYKVLLSDGSILRAYANTIFYSASCTVLTLFLTTLTAYPLAVKHFKGKSGIIIYFTITMFFSGGMIPSFLLIDALGMMNTIWAIIIPGSLGMWYIIIVRTFFQGLPDSLREAALIDGASDFRILFRIYYPLSKPVLATVALFTIVGQWNNFFGPLLYLTDQKLYPLQVVLRKLIITSDLRGTGIEQGMQDVIKTTGMNIGFMISVQMAAIIVSIGPIFFLYTFLQKYFVRGILIGSIKG